MAHVNRQSVCSVEPALWADSWQRVSAGVVRRAACRSEIPSMFAVRMRLSRSRRELSSTCIEPSEERMGSVAGRSTRFLRVFIEGTDASIADAQRGALALWPSQRCLSGLTTVWFTCNLPL